MLKIPVLSVVTIFIFSCGQKNNKSVPPNSTDSVAVDSIAIINDPKSNLNIQTNSFTEIDSSGIIMFPLSMGESDRDSESSYYKEMPKNRYWNIIFYNSHTSAYYLLSERKMLIESFDMRYNTDIQNIAYTGKYILYKITAYDYNNDKKLNSDDPQFLFVSDKEGKKFRQISPANYNLRSWLFVKSTNKILMAVAKDSDNNKKFEDKDEVTTFQIDMDKDSLPTEIFSSEFKNNLKMLYDKDWKRIRQ